MKLQQPFKSYFPISQEFGRNFNNWYKEDGLKGHSGVDFACPTGTPIIAPCDGVVVAVSTDIQRGLGASIMSDETFDWKEPCKFICIHWHFKSVAVKVGDKVKTGDLLGLSDNTGQSTGSHLHFSVIPVATDGSRRPLEPNNGYNNCINPIPYLELEKKPETPKTIKIKELQFLLNKWGAKLKIDGIFGKKSTKALTEFLK